MRERTAPTPAPLSAAQRALWAASAGRPDSPAHHLTADVRLPPAADEPTVRAAPAALAARHGALRTAVLLHDGAPVQQVHPRLPLQLRVVELGMIPERDRPGPVARLADHAARHPFDLATAPLTARPARWRGAEGEGAESAASGCGRGSVKGPWSAVRRRQRAQP